MKRERCKMIKRNRVSVILVTMLMMVAMLATPALAWQVLSPEDKAPGSGMVWVKADQVIDDDLLLVGEQVTIDGTVNGDVLVFANSVDVNGTINGDLLVGCGNLNMAGTINDDLRIGAQNVRITGKVKRNLSAGASQFLLDKEGAVGGNVAVGGENLNVDGLIQGGVQAGVGRFSLSGKIGKNVLMRTDNLNILPTASIGGSLSYRGDNKGNISPGAQIGGPVTYKYFVGQHQEKPQSKAAPLVGMLIWGLVGFMSLLLMWLIWFYLNPSSFIKVEKVLQKAPLAALGWGFALLILLPIAAVITMLTIVGIPIAFSALTVYAAILFLSKLIVGYSLAYQLAVKYDITALQKPFAAAAVGTLGLILLSLIPVVGFFITLVIALMALGSVFVAIKDGLAARSAAN